LPSIRRPLMAYIRGLRMSGDDGVLLQQGGLLPGRC
jgi:hypothetical protein